MVGVADVVTVGSSEVATISRYPIVVQRLEGFMALHSCSFEALRTALPTDVVQPLRLPNGRALLSLALFQKLAVTWGHGAETEVLSPYAELMIGAMVAPQPVSRMALPRLFAGIHQRGIGSFPLHMPLTDAAWRDGGRGSMGLPMFVADFDLDVGGREWTLRVSERGDEILTLYIRPGGLLVTRRDTQRMYGAMGGTLWAAPSRTSLVTQFRPGGATLALGAGHEVAEELRRLEVSPRAMAMFIIRGGRAAVGAPAPIGAAGARPCHPGLGAALGRYTIRYPGTRPIDQQELSDQDVAGGDRLGT